MHIIISQGNVKYIYLESTSNFKQMLKEMDKTLIKSRTLVLHRGQPLY
jgi:hypothetical protein